MADIAFSFGIVHYPARGVYRRTSRDSRVMFMSHGCTYCRRPVPSRRHFSHRPLNMQRTDARAAKLKRQRRENRAPGAATCRARLLPQGARPPRARPSRRRRCGGRRFNDWSLLGGSADAVPGDCRGDSRSMPATSPALVGRNFPNASPRRLCALPGAAVCCLCCTVVSCVGTRIGSSFSIHNHCRAHPCKLSSPLTDRPTGRRPHLAGWLPEPD